MLILILQLRNSTSSWYKVFNVASSLVANSLRKPPCVHNSINPLPPAIHKNFSVSLQVFFFLSFIQKFRRTTFYAFLTLSTRFLSGMIVEAYTFFSRGTTPSFIFNKRFRRIPKTAVFNLPWKWRSGRQRSVGAQYFLSAKFL